MKINFKLFSTALLLLLLAIGEAYSAAAPSIQTRYPMFTQVTTTTARLAWINGNGAKRVVIGTSNALIDWSVVGAAINAAPHNTTEFTDANGNWAAKVQIGTTDAYVVDVLAGSARTSNITGLSGNSAYTFAIFEYNTGGVPNVAYNTTASINNPRTLETAILAPHTLASADPTESSVVISWADPNIPPAASFRLDVSTSNTFATFVPGYQNLNVAASPFTITGLAAATEYFFRLRAVNGSKLSENSDTVSFKTGSTPPVLVNIGDLGLCTGGSVELTFVKLPGMSYILYKNGGVEIIDPNESTTISVAGTYYVGVTNADMIETFSNSLVVTYNNIPAAPTAPAPGTNTYTYDKTLKTATITPPLGSTIVWYDAATGGNVVAAPEGTAVGTYSAWAASLEGTCESLTRTKVDLVINKKVLTFNATADAKVYDGNENATGTFALTNVEAGDDVAFNPATINYAFANKNVATPKAVNITGLALIGVDAGNYSLVASTSVNAAITPLALNSTIVANNKVYNGNTTGSGTITLLNAVVGDIVNASGTFTFDNKSVGNGKTVNVTGIALAGADAGNYTISATASVLANITAKELTFTLAANNRVYNALTTATGTVTLVGVVGGDVVTASGTFAFVDKNVGTGKTVNVTGIALAGIDAGNYSIATTTGSTTANITAKALTTNLTANSKVYNATTATTGTVALVGVEIGDAVTATGTFTFVTKTVGVGKTVNVTAITLAGTDKDNYTVAATTTTQADITPLEITFTVAADDKEYDGTTDATGTVTLAGAIMGDDVDAMADFDFADKNAGDDKTINVTNIFLFGTDAANYSIALTTGLTTADITAKELTFTLAADNKVYDGDTDATGTITLVGVVVGDIVNVTGDFDFVDANAADGKTVNVTNIAISGLDAGNYTIANSGSTLADIEPLEITVNVDAGQNKVYGEDDPALFTYSYTPSLIAPDVFTGALARTAGSNAGNYAITIGTLSLSTNYTITLNTQNFVITQKALTVTADDKERCFGVANPAFTLVYSGFITGEDETNLTTQPTATTVANLASAAGDYDIIPAGGVSTNYSFTYVNGTLTIDPEVEFAVQPTNQSADDGDNVTFTSTVNFENDLQWYILTTEVGAVWSAIVGETSETLNLIAVDRNMDGYQYKLVATNDCNTLESDVVTLTVVPAVPTTQATNIIFNFWSRTEINLSWTRGNGEGCIVVVNEGLLTPASPQLGEVYTPNSVFGLGEVTDSLSLDPLSYVVYNGTGTNVAVTGLTRDKNYTFKVFEYNGNTQGAIVYNELDAANNPRTRKTSIKEVVAGETIVENFSVSSVAPNPVRESLNFSINADKAATYTVEMISMTGEKIANFSYQLTTGTNNIYIPLNGNIAAGVYSLRISDGIEFANQQIVVMP